jgi:hypothetical protein
MKYCYNCNRITPGEPLYCNFCGRSYNVKLCPRAHVNPRNAEACSQCGNRDLSTPQPRTPWWSPIIEFLVSLVPGLFLTIASVVTVIVAVQALLQRPDLLFAFLMLLIALGILWWIWSQLPAWFRTAVYKLMKRKRNGNGRRGGH